MTETVKTTKKSEGKGYSCPICGRDITGKMKRSFAYGSPFRTCEGCEKTYFDERYREICVDGIYVGDRLILPVWKVIGTLVSFAVFGFSLSGWCSWFFGLSVMWAMFAVGGLSLALFLGMNLTDLLDYPKRKKRIRKLELESVARLQDPIYRKQLEEKGRKVLEKYAAILEETNSDESETNSEESETAGDIEEGATDPVNE